jgi:bacillithiol biosynthesis cysteine-adding enzyme BshC
MQIQEIPFNKVTALSSRDLAYQEGNKSLEPFISYPFQFDSLDRAIADRKNHTVDRNLLVSELQNQYKSIPHSELVAEHIEMLAEDSTFSVITAHQPSLLTGPLYYILKICSAINLAKRASSKSHKIVPVFIIGGEDHDFDEINHTYLFGKKISWDREASGSVGRLDLKGFDEIIEQVGAMLGKGEPADDLREKLAFAQKNAKTYGEFSFLFTHAIFDAYGLVIANFDNKTFKKSFAPIIKKEIFEEFSKPLVVETQALLEEKGFSNQAYARDINFFYLHDGQRLRIEKIEDTYHLVDSETTFTKSELEAIIDEFPERFSPNVVMRPIYQEHIMPNLAYIGGGGELAYWMERKTQFEAFGVFFPMLIRRTSAMWLSQKNQEVLSKLGLHVDDLMKDTDLLLKEYALEQSKFDVDFKEYYSEIEQAHMKIEKITEEIDHTLVARIEAMKTNQINGLEKLRGRLIKKIKQQQEVDLNKIRKVKDYLFPNDGLQERRANFMEFYLDEGPELIDILIENCDPFNKSFLVVKA